MKIKRKPSYPQIEPGVYMAVCVGIYGIGEQETTYNGKTKYEDQIYFTFEIPSVTMEYNGEIAPRQISTKVNNTSSEKGNLRKLLKSWRGVDFTSREEADNFEIFEMLGRSAMLNVVVNDKGYADVDSVMPIPMGMPDPSTDTELKKFDADDWDANTPFDDLPEWIQEKIRNSTQWKTAHAPDMAVEIPPAEPEPAPAQTAPAAPPTGRKGVPF